MPQMKKRAARKAAKITARHAAHGVVSKGRRSPLRSLVLLGTGAGVGATTAWLAARRRPAAAPAPAH